MPGVQGFLKCGSYSWLPLRIAPDSTARHYNIHPVRTRLQRFGSFWWICPSTAGVSPRIGSAKGDEASFRFDRNIALRCRLLLPEIKFFGRLHPLLRVVYIRCSMPDLDGITLLQHPQLVRLALLAGWKVDPQARLLSVSMGLTHFCGQAKVAFK